MFDGIFRIGPSGVPRPIPPRPAPLDVRAMLPVLRAEAAEVAVEFLAVAVAQNAVAVIRWVKTNWGADADTRDPCHPARAAALDPTSPSWKLVEAQDALATACWRYRVNTGRDGVALARERIERVHGAALAEYALRPVVISDDNDVFLGDIVVEMGIELAAPPPAPELTPVQLRGAAAAGAAWMLSNHDLGDLMGRLEAMLAAWVADSGDQHSHATDAAARGVETAIESAFRRGVPPDDLQFMLGVWGHANGVAMTFNDQPSTHPSKE